MPELVEAIQTAAGVATALGVLVAGWQLRLSKLQAITQFEDSLATQYREIARRLPIAALLGEQLSDDAQRDHLPHFYHYFDLSNEQAFLHEHGRIRKQTWDEWQEGILQTFRKPAFHFAWLEVSRRAPDSFNELRRVLTALPNLGS